MLYRFHPNEWNDWNVLNDWNNTAAPLKDFIEARNGD
jgi:hypothetical protein